MNKLLIIFIISLFIISILSFSLIAKDDSDNGKEDFNSGSNSGSLNSNSGSDKDSDDNDKETDDNGKSDKKEETKTIIDEQGRKVTVKTETKTENGKTETEEKRTFIDENGNKVTIITETGTKNGETETTVKRKIITPDGTKITFKTKTETKDGKTEIKTSVEIGGVGFETKLEVKEEIKEGITKLKAKFSTGAEQEIITTPDEALKTALAEIGGNITLELTETIKEGTREAVFSAKTKNPGKFLGIFNVNVNLETLIDTQTGSIIKTNRPWWAFLIAGADKATVCHSSEKYIYRINASTIEIPIPAVKAHLAHGDTVGKCESIPCRYDYAKNCDISCATNADCIQSTGFCMNINEDIYIPDMLSIVYEAVACKCENNVCIGNLTGEIAL